MFAGVSNNDTVQDGERYVRNFQVPYAMAHAPEVWEAYGVPYQPVTIIIDADGAIVHRTEGPVTYEGLKEAIEESL